MVLAQAAASEVSAPDDSSSPFPRTERVDFWVERAARKFRDDVASVDPDERVDKVWIGLSEREAECHCSGFCCVG